ncbi:eukaryotic translation initiation factor 5B-like [Contarinia nasturtii]|uniref:eukaryotic translation initiation factor 5B-like n=1 Tax=Contarinia nasturtii TaxID=265458 RepID=UPI0012D3C626|nr:eukaryotic translation initiation factor 5B-like [Contarinia nasturtii]
MEIKKNKLQEIQRQQEFLRFQIETRKKDEEYQRQLAIQHDKMIAELNWKQMQKEANEAEQAKKKQNEENVKFIDFFNRIRSDKKDIHTDLVDLQKLSSINDEIEANAEAERQEKKKYLNKELMKEFIKNLEEKDTAKRLEKEMDIYSFEETQKQNAEYEQMMAIRRAQNRAQFEKDLKDQIEFKNMEMAYNIEQDAKFRQKMDDMDKASCNLTKKLLNEGIDSILPKHPFYRCLLDKE